MIPAGVDDDDLRRAVRSGWLVRAGHGLYRVAGAGVRANDEIYTAWLRLAPGRDAWERLTEPDAVVAGASAAAVYGVGDVPERVHEFIVFRRTQTRDPDVRLHLRRDIGSVRWQVVDDLPVQEPADAAAWILDHGEGDPGHVGQLMREAIATGLVDSHLARRTLGPVARRWNVHLGTLLGESGVSARRTRLRLTGVRNCRARWPGRLGCSSRWPSGTTWPGSPHPARRGMLEHGLLKRTLVTLSDAVMARGP